MTVLICCLSVFVYFTLNLAAVKGGSNGGFGSKSGIKCSYVEIVKRSEWGAASPKSTLENIEESDKPVKKMFIHHTSANSIKGYFDSCSDKEKCKSKVKNIQTGHMNKNFDDIGYNYLVGEDGRAYEGRGWDKKGAHTYGYNSFSVAIAVIGNFNSEKPNDVALLAVKSLIACAIDAGILDENHDLFGHRDVGCSYTECPGDKLYAEIQTWPRYSIKTITKWKKPSTGWISRIFSSDPKTDNSKSKRPCEKYGNINKLVPQGASKATAKLDKLSVTGVKASSRMVDKDLNELNKYKSCFFQTGEKYGIHPALIAALVSRESRGGTETRANRYGLLQCDMINSGLDCKKYGAKSCNHVDMMVKEKLVVNADSMQNIYTDWEPKFQLQGAVAAYDVGFCKVTSYRCPDKGTTRNDYSHDVIARTKRLIDEHKWGCTDSTGSTTTVAPSTNTVAPGSANKCVKMQLSGNCEFYMECVEDVIPCKSTGYALGYGYKYCTKFDEFYSLFDQEGKEWVDQVRICLMKALFPHTKRTDMTCDKLKDIAFDSHVRCYVNSAKGICNIAFSMNNAHALIKIYEAKDFFGKDWNRAWLQVIRTMGSCTNKYAISGWNWVKSGANKVQKTLKQMLLDGKNGIISVFKGRRKRSTDSQCREFARNGDCKFYECFEDKFPCANVGNYSHIKHFELVNCLTFQKLGINNNKIASWMETTQKCLMSELLQYYEKSSVNCLELEMLMNEKHASCMATSEFCKFTKADEWMITRGTYSKGFPSISPVGYTGMPISKSVHMIEMHYYQELNEFKRDIGWANEICVQNGQRKSTEFYRFVDSPRYGRIKIRNDEL